MKRTFVYDKELGKVVETTGQEKETEETRFHIGGQSGFKWNSFSQNKTWIQNGSVVKEKQGKRLSD